MGRGRKRALTQPILSSREPIVNPNSKVQAQAALQSDDSCEDSEELPPNVKRIPKILKDWVKIEYKKALVQYNGIQRTQGLESWITSTTSSVDRLRLRTERRKEMSISFSIPESRALKSNKKGRRGKKQKTIKGLRVMDGVAGPVETLVCRRIWSAKNLPSMLTWTHTERNIRAENIAHLTHIPFMGDDADEDFGAELLSDYEEGIHGVRRGWDKYLNDFMLQRIAQALLPKFRTMKGGEESFYKTIYYLFPNKYTVSEMPTRLADIAVRFSGEPPKKKHPRETFLMDFVHTITTLFCTRCFTFNCLTHGTGTDFVVQDRVLSPPRPLDPKPCGPGCFKKSARKTKLSPGTKKRGKGRCSTTIRRVSSECEIVQEYIKTTASGHGGPQAACRVAKMLSASHMTNKKYTCQELYEFLMESHVDPVDLTEKPKKRTVNEIHSTFRQTRFRLKLGEVNMTHKKIEPCTHKDGPCEVGKCHCLLDGGVCTKFCRCDSECPHRFPGCMCKGSCNTNQCPCFLANFECDPDLCLSCGVDDLCGVATKGCMNVQIQRGFQKRLEVRPSTIAQAGNGCFILEAAKKEELISEYTGEILEHDELERRGRIYDKIGNSYIFHLNQEQGIDAYHVGNLVRFANHLKQPNCRPKLMVINGEHRIGIFAQRDIKAGEELFFDYSYDGFTNRKFVTNSKRAYRRRNASKAPLKKKVQSTEPSRPVEKKKRRVSL